MTARPRLALVSSDLETRRRLAEYLTGAGFAVHECDELSIPGSFASLVLVSGHAADADALRARVRSWLKLASSPRVVVVTAKPSALKDLAALHGARLFVLAAPAFGWDVVDALRDNPIEPRGA
jgi:hypothetical protein